MRSEDAILDTADRPGVSRGADAGYDTEHQGEGEPGIVWLRFVKKTP